MSKITIHNINSFDVDPNEIPYYKFKSKLFELKNQFRGNVSEQLNISPSDLLNYFSNKFPDISITTPYHGFAFLTKENHNFGHFTSNVLIRVSTTDFFDVPYHEKKTRSFDITIFTNSINTVELIKNELLDFIQPFKVESSRYTTWATLDSRRNITYTNLKLKTIENFRPEFYPYINNMDINGYIDDFVNSSSNVLIFLGAPGLGKSSLINYMINYTGWDSIMTYDEEIMKTDEIYINFLINRKNVLILEDADVIMKSRERELNATMSKILNLSDGIIEVGKKFIFTANIQSVDEIDQALTRPGRCFDVVTFRELTLREAEIAAKSIGKELINIKRDSFTVAEIYNKKQNQNIFSLKKVGFI